MAEHTPEFVPIPRNYSRWSDKSLTEIHSSQPDAIRDLLLGRKVTKVTDDHLLLDDGTVLMVEANEGCGGCSSGWYTLDALNGCDNIITSVEFSDSDEVAHDEWCGIKEGRSCYCDSETRLKVFVFAEDKRINLIEVSGSDGNGCYGTGYSLWVRRIRDGKSDG